MISRGLLSFISLLFLLNVFAQSDEQTAPLWMERWREMLEQGADEEEASSLFEQLSALQDNPININQATQEDLQRIPFLSEEQIEALLFYQYTHSPVQTLYELKLVEGLDRETIRLIFPFLYVGRSASIEQKPFLERYFKVYRSKVSLRSEYNFNHKKGYLSSPEGTTPYKGSPFGTQLRFELGNSRHFQAGIALRKSPGEGLDGGISNPSIHLMVRDVGRLKRVVLGDYRVRFGQGLVVNNSFSLGKNSFLQAQNSSSEGLYRAFSTNPELAFRGAAATIALSKSQITAFASLKNVDGRIENGDLISIARTGKYRTQGELSARNQSRMSSFGAHYSYKMRGFKVGSTLLWNRFDRPFRPTARYYNEYQSFGRQSLHVGVDYGYRTGKWDLSGESASSAQGELAFAHQFQVRPADDWSLRLLHRYFSVGYSNLWARSLGESSTVNCEQGCLVAFRGSLSSQLNIEGYVDFFSFRRPKSGISAPSRGWDQSIKLSFNPLSDYLFVASFRYKEKFKNSPDLDDLVALPLPTYSHRLKFEGHYGSVSSLQFHSFVELSRYQMEGFSPAFGSLFAQQVEWSPCGLPLRFFGAVTLFDTQDSNVPFYARDRSSIYSFISPVISGQGARFSVNVRYRPSDCVSVFLQYGRSEYAHKSEIGSGNERIESNHKDDLFVTLSYTFR